MVLREADELLMPVALHAAADDLAFKHVESGEQRGGARDACSRGSSCRAGLLHGQARLGTVERLDLALLVEGQDNGVGRRINIKAHHIAQFSTKLGSLESLN